MPVPSPYASSLAAIPVAEHTVDVLGGTTRYWVYGPADAAVTVLVVHGYRGDHHGLEPVIASLPGIRIIAPDLPGFGASTPLRDVGHDIPGYAAWLDTFAAAVGVRGTAIPLGHSFGSIVTSAAIAAGMPAPRLILVNPITTDPMSGVNGALARLTRLYYVVGRRLPARAGAAWLGNPAIVRFMSVTLAKTPDRALRRWIHEEHGRYFSAFSDRDTLAEGFDASLSTDVTAFTDALTMPTLVIVGNVDMIAPLEGQRRFVETLPDVRLVELDGVGHLVHYEQPQAAAQAISDFVAAP